MSEFKEWIYSENTATAPDTKRLIALAGRVRPIIRDRIQNELSKNIKEIAEEITKSFYHAFYGKGGKTGEAKTLWEFSLSPKPIAFHDERIQIGSAIIAYQLPSNEKDYREPDLTQEEKDKFLKARVNFFVDFLKNTVLAETSLDQITDDFVERIYSSAQDEELIGTQARILWSGAITGGSTSKDLGRILLALRLPPKHEQSLEKVVRDEPAS